MTEFQQDGYRLERKIVEKLAQAIDDRGLKHAPVSKLAFGGDGARWRKIKNTSKNGKPQSLTLTDALALAAAIGVNLDRIIVEAEVDLGRRSSPR